MYGVVKGQQMYSLLGHSLQGRWHANLQYRIVTYRVSCELVAVLVGNIDEVDRLVSL